MLRGIQPRWQSDGGGVRCRTRPTTSATAPWVIRTYAGHSSAEKSNELYRRNLAKGQTGLSVAFDLPTQTGYDPDDELAKGEVGKVGVPVSHIGDMRTLFDGIPMAEANTSMTINAPPLCGCWRSTSPSPTSTTPPRAPPSQARRRTTSSRSTSPAGPTCSRPRRACGSSPTPSPGPSRTSPKWNPINICSYHLQEAGGATPAQELAYALSTAIAVLDAVRDSGQVPAEKFGDVVGRISFFVNAGLRFVEEMCKLRALGRLWDEITLERYGVDNPPRSDGSATACRSTPSGSPRPSRRTTSNGSCWRCSR